MPRTILIVDDSETCLATLEVALMSLPDVEILPATSAASALALLADRGSSVRLLVTDLDLRRTDGFDLIERVRCQPRFSELPIAVISGDCNPRTPERLRRMGVNTYIAKPYSPAEVRQILEPFLDVRT
ncbi:MAG TPA: response regulator [Bryobacteraceae bacterium]|jgi:CheY-like chemotaxis protein|nr:response regulator [Bryobacteraceae bacterium]